MDRAGCARTPSVHPLMASMAKSPHFDVNNILTEAKKKHISRRMAMINHASTAIDGMSGRGKRGSVTQQSI